uniref:Uncharacterized protein n=1 Tax=Fundulus heteroclitus TaxID=8078 RepID=A0A3Q2Q7M9_FUNHE
MDWRLSTHNILYPSKWRRPIMLSKSVSGTRVWYSDRSPRQTNTHSMSHSAHDAFCISSRIYALFKLNGTWSATLRPQPPLHFFDLYTLGQCHVARQKTITQLIEEDL